MTIAKLEAQLLDRGRNLTVITQNTDMLHHRAGSRNVLEMFGEWEREGERGGGRRVAGDRGNREMLGQCTEF